MEDAGGGAPGMFGVEVDFDLIRRAPPTLELELPNGRILVARLDRYEDRGGGDFLWSGSVAGSEEPVLLTIVDDALIGLFGEPGEPLHELHASAGEGGRMLAPGAFAWFAQVSGGFDPGDPALLEEQPVDWCEAVIEQPSPEELAFGQAAYASSSASSSAPSGVAAAQTAGPSVTLTVDPTEVAESVGGSVAVEVTATIDGGEVFASDRAVTISVESGSSNRGPVYFGGNSTELALAIVGEDFAAVADFAVTIPAGAASGSATFMLDLVDDETPEVDEAILISGSLPGATVHPTGIRIEEDDQHVIDVLWFYTAGVHNLFTRFTTTPQTEAQSHIDYTNRTYQRSRIPAKLNLIQGGRLPTRVDNKIRNSGHNREPSAMRGDDTITRLRDQHNADIVFVQGYEGSQHACGLGIWRHEGFPTAPSYAAFPFAWGNVGCSRGLRARVTAHEIGHLLGADHNAASKWSGTVPPLFLEGLRPYAFGYNNPREAFVSGSKSLATIMSYSVGATQWLHNYSTARLKLVQTDEGVAQDPAGREIGGADTAEVDRLFRQTVPGTARLDEWMPAGPPSGVTGTATLNGTTVDVSLSWTDESSREALFIVAYRRWEDEDFTEAAMLAPNTTSTTLTGFATGTRYVFRVLARNVLGRTWYGDGEDWEVRTPGSGPPGRPTDLIAETPDPRMVRLGWKDNASSETGFEVEYRALGVADWSAGPAVAADVTTADVTGLDHDSEYEFRVAAVNADGRAYSDTVGARTLQQPAPSAPRNLFGRRLDATAVHLEWTDTASEETGFAVESRPAGAGEWSVVSSLPADTESAYVVNLARDAALEFRVLALGPGASSSTNAVTIDLSVEAPPAVALTGEVWESAGRTSRLAHLEWTAPDSWTGRYWVWSRSETDASAGKPWTRKTTESGSTHLDFNVFVASEDLEVHDYRVETRSAGGSVFSNVVRLDLQTSLPGPPANLASTRSGRTEVTLTWTAATNVDSWEVRYEWYDEDGDGTVEVVHAWYPANATQAVVDGLAHDRPDEDGYSFRVAAINANGRSIATVTDVVIPAPPNNRRPPNPASNLDVSLVESGKVTLTWDDNSRNRRSEQEFRVALRTDRGAWQYTTVARDTVTTDLENLDPATLYHVRVLAHHNNNGSLNSEFLTFRPAQSPGDPRAVATDSSTVELTWTDRSEQENRFQTQYRAGSSAWTTAGTLARDSVAGTITGLDASTEYAFRVRAEIGAEGSDVWEESEEILLTTPPAAPGSPSAVTTGSTSVDVSWSDASSDETGFFVQSRTAGTTEWTTAARAPEASLLAEVDSLTPAADYEFQVLAYHSVNGRSTPSVVVSATMPPPPPSSLEAAQASSTSVNLTWTEPAGASGYRAEFRETGAAAWTSPAMGDTVTFTVTGAGTGVFAGLAAGTGYEFRVRAEDTNGGLSSPSPVARIDVLGAPNPPSGLTATADGPSRADLTWTDNSTDETGFDVEWRTVGAETWMSVSVAAGSTSHTVTGLTGSAAYEFRVAAVNVNGANPGDVVSLVMPPAEPGAFTVTTSGSTSVDLAWADSSIDEDGFDVEYRPAGATAWTLSETTAADATGASIVGLTAGSSYDFRVAARNANGASPTAAVSIVMPPPPPSDLAAANSSGTDVTLTWTDNSTGETGFVVEYQIAGAIRWTAWDTEAAADATTLTVTGLAAGNLYLFRVRARGPSGLSTPSDSAVLGDLGGPAAPGGVTAAASGSTNVMVTWVDNSADEVGFAVEYRWNPGAQDTWVTAALTAPDTTGAMVGTLDPSRGYEFRVSSRSATGGTASGGVTLTMPPAPPRSPSVSELSMTSAAVSWTDVSSDETGFVVDYRLATEQTWSRFGTEAAADATSIDVTGLVGGTYAFRVLAKHSVNGESSPSEVVWLEDLGVPGPPTGVTVAAAGSTSVEVSWTDASSDETSFKVEYRTGGGDWMPGATAAADATSATVTGLAASTAYEFRVLAVNMHGSMPSGLVALTMPPAAPTDLSATELSASNVRLSWTDASSDETGFVVEYRVSGDEEWTTYATEAAADAVSLTVTALTAGATYEFRVFAKHATNGLSTPSDLVTAGPLGAPEKPTGVTVAADGSTSVTVSWTDESSDETGFRVEYRASGDEDWTAYPTVAAADAVSLTVTGLSASTAYEFRVSSVSANGARPSDPVSLTMPPAAPSGPVAEAASATSVTLSWSDESSDETGFVVEHRVVGAESWTTYGTEASAGAETITVTGLQSGANHEFRVFAKHSVNGLSSPSATVSVSRLGAPNAPTGVAVAATGSTSVEVSWTDASSDETSFVVEHRTGGGEWMAGATVTADVTATTLTGLSASTSYEWRVSAVNAHGSSPSDTVPLTMPPAAPTDLSASPASPTSVTLTWTDASSDEAGFVVEYREVGAESWTTWGTEASANVGSLTVTGLTAGESYEFRVFAKHGVNGSSSPSNEVQVSMLGSPSSPTGLSVVADGSTSVAVTWTDSSTTETSFEVEYRLSGGETWSSGSTTAADATSATVTGLSASTSYEFRVLAVNEHGSMATGVASLTLPPSAPTGVSATELSSMSVRLDWTDASSDETGFVAEHRALGAEDWTVYGTEAASDAESLTLTALTAGTSLEFRVFAKHSVNGLSSPSGVVTAGPLGAPATPTGVSVAAAGSTSVTVSWTDASSDETGFRVEHRRGEDAWETGAMSAADATSASVSGLLSSTSYEFRVSSVNANGARPSGPVSLTLPPAAPAGLVATASSSTSVTLNWSDESSDETGFVVEHRVVGVETWTTYGTEASAGAETITVTGLQSGANHEFRVFAKHSANGLSSPSGTASVSQLGAPNAPTGLSVAATGSTSVEVSWTDASTDEASFLVERRTGGGAWTTAATTLASVTSVDVVGLSSSTSYEFRVSAVNAHGSTFSVTASLTLPPAAPSGLTAVEGSSTAAILAWADESSDETGFVVDYRESGAESWTRYGTESSADATSATVTGLTAGAMYEFRVFAKHSVNGLSSPSNVASLGGLGVPEAPAAVAATPTGSTSVAVTWTDGSLNETGFRVERRQGALAWQSAWTGSAGSESASVTGLSASGSYDFRVVALNANGSTASDPVSVTMPPPAPTGLSAERASSTSASLSWADPSQVETGFAVEYRLVGAESWTSYGTEASANATTLTVTGLSDGAGYEFRVRARGGDGLSSPSNVASLAALGGPEAPSGVQVTALGSTSVTVSWVDESSDETGFAVEHRTGGGAWASGATASANATSAQVSGLSASTSYEFRVSSTNGYGSSPSSPVAFVMPPAAPSGLTASPVSATSVKLAWVDESTDETGFIVEYRASGDQIWTTYPTQPAANATTVTVTGLTSGTVYEFRLVARRGGSLSSPSGVATAGGVTPPAAPSGVQVRALGSTSVEVSWVDESTDETGFVVEHRKAGSSSWSSRTVGASVTRVTISGLSSSTSYEYQVSSTNANGRSTSAVVSSTTPPAAPSGLTGSVASETSVELSWTDESSDETGFVAEYREQGVASWSAWGPSASADATSMVLTGLTAGTVYEFRVSATSEHGQSTPSNVAVVRLGVLGVPAAPTGLAVVDTGPDWVSLQWSDNSTDETGFVVEYRESGERTWLTYRKQPRANEPVLTLTRLASGTWYDFRVRAVNEHGPSEFSNLTSGTTEEEAPPDPDPDPDPDPEPPPDPDPDPDPDPEPPPEPEPPPPANRPPFFDLSAPVAFAVEEGSTGPVGPSLLATDPDGDALSYYLGGPDSASFVFNTLTGRVSYESSVVLDASVKSSYRFDVVASDGEFRVRLPVTVNVVAPELPVGPARETAPAAPSDLAARLLTSEAVVLTWRDNADDETGHDVFHRERPGAWKPLRSLGADVETATIEGLSAGVAYEFLVAAVSGGGSSASNVATVELWLAPPTHLDTRVLDDSSVRVTWRDNSIAETGFEVNVWLDGGSSVRVILVEADATSVVLDGLASEGRYSFRIAAVDEHTVALSRTASFTLRGPPQGGEPSNCEATRGSVILSGDYEVRMCFETPSGTQVDASNYHLESTASGLLYFFDRDNVEVLVKVLDGCAVNSHKWVFIAPVTNLAFNLEIVERTTGRRFTHRNSTGLTAASVSDTAAFPCGPEQGASFAAAAPTWPAQLPGVGASDAASIENEVAAGVDPTSATTERDESLDPPVCEPEGPGIELEDGHRIDMCFETPDGEVGQARDWGLSRRSSALLYFFERENVEVLVKVLDGCAVNDHRWVFAAPVTDLAFQLVVTSPDGQRWTHQNHGGSTASSGSDTAAFPCR